MLKFMLLPTYFFCLNNLAPYNYKPLMNEETSLKKFDNEKLKIIHNHCYYYIIHNSERVKVLEFSK